MWCIHSMITMLLCHVINKPGMASKTRQMKKVNERYHSNCIYICIVCMYCTLSSSVGHCKAYKYKSGKHIYLTDNLVYHKEEIRDFQCMWSKDKDQELKIGLLGWPMTASQFSFLRIMYKEWVFQVQCRWMRKKSWAWSSKINLWEVHE